MSNTVINYDEVRRALELIRDVCVNHDCERCPFSNSSAGCLVTMTSPNDWEIVAPEPVIRLMR